MCRCAGTGARAPRKQRGGWKWVSWYMYRVFPTDAGCSCCSRSLADWNDLFMLGLGAACCVTTGLHAKPATVNFRKKKSFGLSLFVCHAKSSWTGALRPHHLSGSGHLRLRFPLWMFPCDSPPTSSQQRSGEISSWKRPDAGSTVCCFYKALYFFYFYFFSIGVINTIIICMCFICFCHFNLDVILRKCLWGTRSYKSEVVTTTILTIVLHTVWSGCVSPPSGEFRLSAVTRHPLLEWSSKNSDYHPYIFCIVSL